MHSGRNPRPQSNSPAPCRCEFRISTRNFGTRVRALPDAMMHRRRVDRGSVPRPGSLHPWSPVRRASLKLTTAHPPRPAESLELEMVGAIRALTSTASSPRTPKSDSRGPQGIGKTFSQVRLSLRQAEAARWCPQHWRAYNLLLNPPHTGAHCCASRSNAHRLYRHRSSVLRPPIHILTQADTRVPLIGVSGRAETQMLRVR